LFYILFPEVLLFVLYFTPWGGVSKI
jgi:hypothetical protein